MIVVDTSVWVAVLRPRGTRHVREAKAFTNLLDADEMLLPLPVRTELFSGVRPVDRPALQRTLSALPLAYPTDETWRLMDLWALKGAELGERFGVRDLLIAAIAKEAGAAVWSLDSDFERMARLKFVDLYEP